MNLPIEKKLEFVSQILETFGEKFKIVNMREHAESVRAEKLKSLDYAKQTA